MLRIRVCYITFLFLCMLETFYNKMSQKAFKKKNKYLGLPPSWLCDLGQAIYPMSVSSRPFL